MRLLASYCIVFLLAACASGDSSMTISGDQNADPADWERWSRLGEPVWRFDSAGVEAGSQEAMAFLLSTDEFKDFRLSVEFWVENNTNSGIFIRCRPASRVADLNPDRCYEINIWDEHPDQNHRTGSIVTLVTPAAHVNTVGKWNRYVIEAVGSSIEVTLNGQNTASLDDDRSAVGLIALQYAGKGLLRFRKLTIEEL